jgi:hypothetical protein
VATLGARNVNEAMVALWWGLKESAFGRNLASVAVKMFSHVTNFIKKFYKCTFSAICKDNAAINCITVEHKKVSFPSSLTGQTLLLVFKQTVDLDVDGRIILKCISGKLYVRVWIELIWLKIGTGGGIL